MTELTIREEGCSRDPRKEKWVRTGCFYFQEIIALQKKKNEWIILAPPCPTSSAKKKEAKLLTFVEQTETTGRSSKQKIKRLHK